MSDAVELICFLWMALGAYRRAKASGRPQYFGICSHNVPAVCCYVATGREAWRVSQIAMEAFR